MAHQQGILARALEKLAVDLYETDFHFVTECFFLALVSGRRASLRARLTLRAVGSRLGAGPKP